MKSVKLEFDVEDNLNRFDAFLGVHSNYFMDKDNEIERELENYVEEGPENYMSVIGYGAGCFEKLLDAEKFDAVGAELPDTDIGISGLPPAYVSDIKSTDNYLDMDRAIGYSTEPFYVRDFGSAETAFDLAREQLEDRWFLHSWYSEDDTVEVWEYFKGSLNVFYGRPPSEIEKKGIDNSAVIRSLSSEIPFDSREALEEELDNALRATMLERDRELEVSKAREFGQKQGIAMDPGTGPTF